MKSIRRPILDPNLSLIFIASSACGLFMDLQRTFSHLTKNLVIESFSFSDFYITVITDQNTYKFLNTPLIIALGTLLINGIRPGYVWLKSAWKKWKNLEN